MVVNVSGASGKVSREGWTTSFFHFNLPFLTSSIQPRSNMAFHPQADFTHLSLLPLLQVKAFLRIGCPLQEKLPAGIHHLLKLIDLVFGEVFKPALLR